MISASVYRESSTLLNIGVNRANFTNTIEPTKNCQKVKFNAMFATVILLSFSIWKIDGALASI